jgi:hypothetical protein
MANLKKEFSNNRATFSGNLGAAKLAYTINIIVRHAETYLLSKTDKYGFTVLSNEFILYIIQYKNKL